MSKNQSSSLYRNAVILTALLLALPVIVVLTFVFVPSGEVWAHLASTVLDDYIQHSLLLMLGVSIGTLLLGVSTAWLTTMCQFPGRSVFEWALLLPMAMPAYIIAYTYTGMLDFSGPVQTAIRDLTGWGYGDYWFPQIRSLGGAIVMLTLVLYPYVYLLSRAAFLNQSICVLDVSRTLGNGPWRTFYKVALPLARPAIIAGLSLVLMETLADFGTVQYFGVSTFTTGIFRTWFGLGSAAAAAQLAAGLMVFVFALIILERLSRRQARYHHTSRRHQDLRRYILQGNRAMGAFGLCLLILLFGFLLPATQLASWTWQVAGSILNAQFLDMLLNSLQLAAIAAMLALLIALAMAYGQRLYPSRSVRFAVRLAGMGYAVPGAVIAVGVMIPFAWLDNTLDSWLRDNWSISSGLLLSGTLVAVTFAYLCRFLAVALQTVESGLGKITPAMDEVGRSLGYQPMQALKKIHVPLLQGSLLTALLLVFVDVLKELPATLILRPFNFNTLAVRAYELASDERLAEAAPAALAIVVAGIIPVILLSRTITRSRRIANHVDANLRETDA
ncbi:Ferric iron ABC transporter, permease protein [Methylophaga frappieri]|uniref:Ferric iron ABC transporter, permease protein n=1 Tax=Methylophaga frappieri (strain ATCC BAA-2434 / DSM 25690 / JAM7) TaxID=754477 RepID=I1YHT7_METFJ|nr:iron ABC transporter permease [Methylophaga frappieri]AFJ02480.1 Ferric iron ABC transporter, permease protein [Methylophaga frappieri]